MKGLDFRRCECGVRYARDHASCPTCGRDGFELPDLFVDRRFYAVAAPAVTTLVVLFGLSPNALEPWLTVGQQALLEEVALALGVLPALVFFGWLGWRARRRDPVAVRLRLAELDQRVGRLRDDLRATQRRLGAARRDLERAPEGVMSQALAEEVEQDRRLREAQRALLAELTKRAEQLRVVEWREELAFFEACRDARRDAPELAAELATRIEDLEADLDARDAPDDLWLPVLEEAWATQRALSRGIPRLLAAARLDPLARVDLVAQSELPQPRLDGSLADETEDQLDRIERAFEVLEELELEIAESDASGVHVRVDDDLIETFEEALAERRRQREGAGRESEG